MNRRQREIRKQELLDQVAQQRIALHSASQQWIIATSGYDNAWFKLVSLRRYLAVGGGLAALWAVRRPKRLLLWSRRAVGLWSSWRMVRKLIAKH